MDKLIEIKHGDQVKGSIDNNACEGVIIKHMDSYFFAQDSHNGQRCELTYETGRKYTWIFEKYSDRYTAGVRITEVTGNIELTVNPINWRTRKEGPITLLYEFRSLDSKFQKEYKKNLKLFTTPVLAHLSSAQSKAVAILKKAGFKQISTYKNPNSGNNIHVLLYVNKKITKK
tara:strand:- start:1121 stop:1639 length:519 start_codon:yes stop_codon:yes gene_type:complete